MATLPDDILLHVFCLVPKDTLLTCRFVSRAAGALATSLAFKHVRLEATCEMSPSRFISIAASDHLRRLVRKVTIDAREGDLLQAIELHPRFQEVGDVFRQWQFSTGEARLQYGTFMAALPQLRNFPSLQSLHLALLEGIAVPAPGQLIGINVGSSAIINTLLECVTGRWDQRAQMLWGNFLQDLEVLPEQWPASLLAEVNAAPPPLPVSCLMISRLLDQEFLALPSLELLASSQPPTTLKLLMNGIRSTRPWNKLPSTWLAPPIAANLRVLSLFGKDYFGWTPKLDFRSINPGYPFGGFPSLRVLALGKFVFSHDWQISWISSLGGKNGRGGLQELYLDDCPIMWRARTLGPLDTSVTRLENGIVLDNNGYPLLAVLVGQEPYHNPGTRYPINIDIDLRWSRVLEAWRRDMHALRVFKMGSGNWDGDLPIAHPLKEDAVHLTYDDPNGFLEERQHVLQYVHFDYQQSPSRWIERDFQRRMVDEEEEGWERYQASRAQDEEALRRFQNAVASRNAS